MPLLVRARSFLGNLFFLGRRDSDLDQEIRSHLEMLIEENIRAGMPASEAQRAARIELGGSEQVKRAGPRNTDGQLASLGGLRLSLRRSTAAQESWVCRACYRHPSGGHRS